MGLLQKRKGLNNYALVALAFVFLLGQGVGALLQLYGWPSEWFK